MSFWIRISPGVLRFFEPVAFATLRPPMPRMETFSSPLDLGASAIFSSSFGAAAAFFLEAYHGCWVRCVLRWVRGVLSSLRGRAAQASRSKIQRRSIGQLAVRAKTAVPLRESEAEAGALMY